MFVEALGRLNRDVDNKRDILAFILVPAGHKGANLELLNNLERSLPGDRNHTSLRDT